MAETDPSFLEAPKPKRRMGRWVLIIFILIILLTAAGFLTAPRLSNIYTPHPNAEIAEIQQRLSLAEKHIEELEASLNQRNADKITSSESAETAPPPANETLALSHMQNDLVALSAAVTGLQAELKQTGTTVLHSQEHTQSSLSSALAFIQLHDAAESGRSFKDELSIFRSTVKQDGDLLEMSGKLEPYAVKGVPNLEKLRADFFNLEPALFADIDRAQAQNWYERIGAELKHLVSIRHVHEKDETDALTTLRNALLADDLNAALAASTRLPSAGDETLKDWRLEAEARQMVDKILHDLTDHFVASVQPPPSPKQDEP